MPIRPIVPLGDPRLRETASPVKDPRLPQVSLLVKDLAHTLALPIGGPGLAAAAPQLGVGLRVIFLPIACWRSLAISESRNYRAQSREDRRVGRLPEFSFNLYASGTAARNHCPSSRSLRRVA